MTLLVEVDGDWFNVGQIDAVLEHGATDGASLIVLRNGKQVTVHLPPREVVDKLQVVINEPVEFPWVANHELNAPMVCTVHKRFVPCRVNDRCFLTSGEQAVERVRKYQQGE